MGIEMARNSAAKWIALAAMTGAVGWSVGDAAAAPVELSIEDHLVLDEIVTQVNGLYSIGGGMVGGGAGGPAEYDYQRQSVGNNLRVHHISWRIKDVSPEVRAALGEYLRRLIAKEVQAYPEHHRAWEVDKKAGKTGTDTSTALRLKYESQNAACAAVYLLGELRDYDALPDLLKLYHQEGPTPVPPLYAFAVVHELVHSYPSERLTGAANALRDRYLEATKELARAELEERTDWLAVRDENGDSRPIESSDLGPLPRHKVTIRKYAAEIRKLEEIPGRRMLAEWERVYLAPLAAFVGELHAP